MHSLRIEPISRSAYAFCQGERGDVGRSRIPMDLNSTHEYFAVCAIPVPDQVARDLLPATSLSELVGDPFSRRMRGDAEPQDLPPAMSHDQQAIEKTERDCRNHERSIAAMPSAWLRRKVFHPCDGAALLRAIYLATLVWPISMPSLRSSPWILGAPHNRFARLISRISRRISSGTIGRSRRRRDFQRQYDLKPARCQRITVSGRTMARASYILGNRRQTAPNISLSIEMKRARLGQDRRSTLICCLRTRISASSATRDRSRSITIPKINLHKSNIEQQQHPILDQPPAGLDLR